MIGEHKPQYSRSRTSFLALRTFAFLGVAIGVSLIGLIGYSIATLWSESTDRAFFVANDLAPPPNVTQVRQESLWTLIKLRAFEQRSLGFSYWDALNDYDVDRALSFLEDGYAPEFGSEIRAQVEQLRQSDGPLTVTEDREPFMINFDEAVMFFALGEPPDTSRVQMTFVRADGGWKIRSVQQAP